MSFKIIDLKRNNIVKQLGSLLPQIDPRVKWTDYIPGDAIKTGQSLIAIGMINGDTKYVDITKKSPFKLVNEVLNAMDDYCLSVQFLNSRQMDIIKNDISTLAKDRAKVATDTLEKLQKNYLSEKDYVDIIYKAQDFGIFPEFFPAINEQNIPTKILESFLKTSDATIIDTQIISDLVEETILKRKENQKDLIDNIEDYELE